MKPFWKSKTLWFNVLVALLATVESQVEMLKPFLGAEGYAALVLLVPAINVGLRLISTAALTK